MPSSVFHSVFSHLENMVGMFSVASVSLFLIQFGFAVSAVEHSCKIHSRPAEATKCKKKKKEEEAGGKFLRGRTDQRSRTKTKSKEQCLNYQRPRRCWFKATYAITTMYRSISLALPCTPSQLLID